MAIGDFSKVVKQKITQHIQTNTKLLRAQLQNSFSNSLDLSPDNVKALLGDIANKGNNGLASTTAVTNDIEKKAHEIYTLIKRNDVEALEEKFNVRLLNEENVLFTFNILQKIKEYIFKGDVKGISYDLSPEIHRGHTIGVATQQFFNAANQKGGVVKAGSLAAHFADQEETLEFALPQLFKKMGMFLMELDRASSNLAPKKLTVNRRSIRKGKDVTEMKVEFQFGAGNEESGKEVNLLKRKFLTAYKVLFTDDGVGSNNLAKQKEYLDRIVNGFVDGSEKGYLKELAAARETLIDFINDETLVDRLINVRGSPSYKEVVISKVVEKIKNNAKKGVPLAEYTTDLKVNIKQDDVLRKYRNQLKSQLSKIEKLKADAAKAAKKNKELQKKFLDKTKQIEIQVEKNVRNLKGQFLSPVRLQYLINTKLRPTIVKNMTRPNLINRTGRFASSAIVTDVSTRTGKLQAFYTYMKYPYQTFEPGFQQGNKGYDPRRVIEQSIKEIAKSLTKARFSMIRQ